MVFIASLFSPPLVSLVFRTFTLLANVIRLSQHNPTIPRARGRGGALSLVFPSRLSLVVVLFHVALFLKSQKDPLNERSISCKQ